VRKYERAGDCIGPLLVGLEQRKAVDVIEPFGLVSADDQAMVDLLVLSGKRALGTGEKAERIAWFGVWDEVRPGAHPDNGGRIVLVNGLVLA
jgi:hypothetical protein